MIKFKFKKCFCESVKQNLEKDFLKLDYYSILNINKHAGELEIKKSYLHLAKRFHPDKYKGPPEIFKKISEAYHTLKDNHKREEYNKKMRFKIRKKNKSKNSQHQKSENSENSSENEKTREFSKYEEEFKKINIDRLFIEFTSKKIKTNPGDIKVLY